MILLAYMFVFSYNCCYVNIFNPYKSTSTNANIFFCFCFTTQLYFLADIKSTQFVGRVDML